MAAQSGSKAGQTSNVQGSSGAGQTNYSAAASTDCQVLQLYGDVNNDRRHDLSDALCVLNAYAGDYSTCAFAFADVFPCGGGNGMIDVSDVQAVLAAYGGEFLCPDACPPCQGNVAPVARGGPDLTGTTAESFQLDGRLSTDADGIIVTYEWDLGNGTRSRLPALSHSYSVPGIYTVTLAVQDSCGAVATDTVRITVTAAICGSNNQAPIAEAGADRASAVGASVSFNGSASTDPDGNVVEYWWSFGNGYSTGWQTSPLAQHSYLVPGTFTATLWVKDNCGRVSAADTARVFVGNNPCANNQPPVAVLTGPASALTGQSLTFSAAGSTDLDGTIQSYSWSLGNGQSASGASITHTYASAGTYTVTLTVTDNCGAVDTESLSVVVSVASCGATNQIPLADGGSDRTANVNVTLTFNASASRDFDGTVTQYWWNFGDGYSTGWQNSPIAQHAYAAPAVYTARLWVRDNCGASSAPDNVVVTITGGTCSTNQPPIANAGPDLTGEAQEAVSFSAAQSSDPDGWIQTYAWNFGDGTSGTGLNVSHTYAAAGVYSVTLTVTDNCGASRADIAIVTVAPSSYVPISPDFVGWVEGSFGTVQGIRVSPNGQRVYLASQELGVVEFNTADPRNPVYSRTSTVFQNAQGIVANDQYMMIGGSTTGASYIPVSTFGTASENWISLGYVAQGMALHGDMAAIAAGASGFKFVRLSGANAPQLLGSINMFARGVAMSPTGQYAYVAAGPGTAGGFKVVDIRTTPAARGSLAPTGTGNSSDVVLDSTGNYAFVAEGSSGLRVVDIRNPDQPVHVTSRATDGTADRVARTGSLLAVTVLGNSPYLQMYNVANPAAPQALGRVSGYFIAVDARGNYVYCGSAGAGWVVIDVTQPSQPQVAWSRAPSMGNRNALAAGTVANRKIAVVGGNQAGAQVVDIANPFRPVHLAAVGSVSSDIALRGNRAYLAAGSSGFRVVDLTNPSAPVLGAQLQMFALGVALHPTQMLAYVGAGSEGVKVVDILNGANPTVRSVLDTPGNAADVALNSTNQLLYVADNGTGLVIMDVSIPTAPRILSSLKLSGAASYVAPYGHDIAVVVSSGASPGLCIVDTSVPSQPSQIAFLGGLSGSIAIYEHYVLVTSGLVGVNIVDIRDPAAPTIAYSADAPGSVLSAAVIGDFAYLGDGASMLDVLKLR